MNYEFFTSDPHLTGDDIIVAEHEARLRPQYLTMRQIPANERARILNLLKVSDEAMRCISCMGEYGIETMDDRLVRFIRCNFGALDHVDDITADNVLNFEYVECGFKHNNRCPWKKEFCVRKTKTQ